MKLIVQIPAFNEEETLAETISAIPRQVDGFSLVEILVIDDGSVDNTVEVAKNYGAEHILKMGTNVGLARAFSAGIEKALTLGADVIVNTDADNQYCSDDIHKLVSPILLGESQIVIGERPIMEIQDFSPLKKYLQRIGSWVVKLASGANIPDAPSGFRAYSRYAAARLCVFNTFTYTLETIIQAGRKNIAMTTVPVRVNIVKRPSRLFTSTFQYVMRSAQTTIRVFITYAPIRFFLMLSALFGIPGVVGISRFLYFYLLGDSSGHIQSLILSSALVAIATILFAVGILADLIAVNRLLLEDIRAREILAMTHRKNNES